MSRISNSFDIAKRSVSVLASDKKLVSIPVMGLGASLAAAGAFAGLGFALPGGISTAESGSSVGPMLWVLIGFYYFVQAFIGTYFLAALIAAADIALRGGSPSLGDAFGAVNARFGRIVQWSLITATVSIILSVIRNRLGFLGAVISGLIGGAWEVLTFLTVPVILEEDAGPIKALRRSGTLFKQTWGENLVANIGLGVLGVLLVLPALVIGAVAIMSNSAPVMIPLLGIALVWLLCASMVLATLSGIYRAALYRFAVDGRVPAAFEGIDMAHAFKAKTSRL